MTEQLTVVGRLAVRYEKKPYIKSLLQLIPSWGAADTLLQQRADEIRSDRIRIFFDELSVGKINLTEDIIQSDEFLHCYFCTLRAALNTRQHEKIQLFARLLDSSIIPDSSISSDEYEEILAVLDSVTLREFRILCNLRQHELAHPQSTAENELQNAWHYWGQFKKDSIEMYGIPADAFTAFMAKLERTGLYLRITGGFSDYSGDVGRTTPLFARLIEIVTEMKA